MAYEYSSQGNGLAIALGMTYGEERPPDRALMHLAATRIEQMREHIAELSEQLKSGGAMRQPPSIRYRYVFRAGFGREIRHYNHDFPGPNDPTWLAMQRGEDM